MTRAYATLIDLSRHRADAAAAQMGQLARRLDESQGKRDMLASYRDEYRARLDAAARHGAALATLANFRAFVARLDDAVAQQEGEAAFWRERVAEARARWRGERRSLDAYAALSDRRAERAARAEARRDQRRQDEFAARIRPAFGL
jgi:flagellar FliJ protein